MTGKGREGADMMERRRVEMLCVQETKWKGSKSRNIGGVLQNDTSCLIRTLNQQVHSNLDFKDVLTQASLQEWREDTDEQETSEEWLKWRSLESCGLTLSHFLSHCSTAPVSYRGDGEDAQLEIDSETLNDFEMQLYQAIEMFHSRIQWLTRGSRKIFGMVPGSRLGVLVDSSDVSCFEERLSELQRHLLLLVQEQLRLKKQLHLMLQEVQEWILRLIPSGNCNLLQGLEKTRSQTHLDSLLIILSSCSDLELLWAEIKTARSILHHIQNARQHGRLNHTPVSIVSEISTDLEALSLSDLNSGAHTAVHGAELCVQPAGPLPSSSAEWLRTNGLKAKNLNLYHVLAPNIYTPLEGFVPILGKKVQSKVHEKATVQFEWHDGTLKNMHVDLPLLQSYQRRLLEAEGVLEDRVMWLNTFSSRQIWGTVCEQSVQIVLDVSDMSDHHQLHIQHAVRLLLQEQLPSTHRFNIIAFGADVKAWRERAVSSNPQNLQEAWQWVQKLECAGDRNTLAALRHATESEPQDSSLTRGVYLFTTGAPDQDHSVLFSYVSEFCTGLRIHVCLFTREVEPLRCSSSHHVSRVQVALILRNLAHCANGRFHWITDTGIVESDDITTLTREMEEAADYWQKCCDLVDSLLQRSSSADQEEAHAEECHSPAHCTEALKQKHTLPPPRETRLSSARLGRTEVKPSTAWRPNSAKALIPPAHPPDGWKPIRITNSTKVKKKRKISCSAPKEEGSPGSVFNHLKANSIQKRIHIPKNEDVSSSKQWLSRFGIRSLKLDLHKLLSVPACTHRTELVTSVSRSVSAKYCTIFPSVHLNGRERHLFLSSGELKQYLIQSERLLQRYAHRMQWLLSGSRRVFGCVLERDVCIVLDVSGSMSPHFTTLYTHLISLIWDQLHTCRVRFSMVAFSELVQVWQEELVEASEERCRDAVTWLSQLNTHGGTSILHALKAACVFGDSVGVYVISDGRWDCSCSLVLEEVERLTSGKHITIHTVTLSDPDSTDVFLKSLAHQTGGRFHQVPTASETAMTTELLSSSFSAGQDSVLPEFQGDDLKRLRNEIEKLRMFQKQAKDFRCTFPFFSKVYGKFFYFYFFFFYFRLLPLGVATGLR
ncbi:von Willebrand factor A domain-containing protein 3A-like isoform X1 [Silurus meridionalis]|nr:von Willebrand factor A domain-containing protein 3A-like isoform X1 [Silurus meridionalis]